MSHIEMLERLAERGSPTGPDAMCARLDLELTQGAVVRATIPVERRQRRWIPLVVACLVLVATITTLTWNVVIDDAPDVADSLPPLRIGESDGLWPIADATDPPEVIAERFVDSVLGWEVAGSTSQEAPTCLPHTRRPGTQEFCYSEVRSVEVTATEDTITLLVANAFTMSRTREAVWKVVLVGGGYMPDQPTEARLGGTRIPIPTVAHAATADILVTTADDPWNAATFTATSDDLRRGYLDVRSLPNPDRVTLVTIRYRAENGAAVAAVGGPKEFIVDEPPPLVGEPVVAVTGTWSRYGTPWQFVVQAREDGEICMGMYVADSSCHPPTAVDQIGLGLSYSSGGTEDWCLYGTAPGISTVRITLDDWTVLNVPTATVADPLITVFVACGPSVNEAPRPLVLAALDADGEVVNEARLDNSPARYGEPPTGPGGN